MTAYNVTNRRQPKGNNTHNSRPHTVFGSQSLNSMFGKSPNGHMSRLEDLPEEGELSYNRKNSTSSVNTFNGVQYADRSFSSGQSNLAIKLGNANYSLESLNSISSNAEENTLAKLTSKNKHESSTSIIKEGYLNKKVDMIPGSVTNTLTRSWKLYYVTLLGAKLSFYKPPTEAEVRNSIAFSTSSLGSSSPLSSSPSSVFSKTSRSPSSTGMPLIPATFDSNARSLLFSSTRTSKPLSEKYVYGDIFTEVDVLHFKFKRYTCLLIFDELLMVFKRRWIRNNRTSIFNAVNDALKIGSPGNLNEEMDPSKGSFTKWKHHATYKLKDCDVIDASSTVFNTGNGSSRNPMFSHTNSSASSISTLTPQNDYSTPLASGKVQAFQLFILDKVRTTRLFVAPNSESKLAWTSRLSASKELPASEVLPMSLPDESMMNEMNSSFSRGDGASFTSEALSTVDPNQSKQISTLDSHPELLFNCASENAHSLSRFIIESGTVDALIHEAIFASKTYKNGTNYREVFLFTYPLFTTSSAILDMLKHYRELLPRNEVDFTSEDQEINLRIAEFIAAWLSLSSFIICEDTFINLESFIKQNLISIESRFNLLSIYTNLKTKFEHLQNEVLDSPNPTDPGIAEVNQNNLSSLIKTGLTPSVFLKMDPQELAQQLYAFHYQVIGKYSESLGDPKLILGLINSGLNIFSYSSPKHHFLTKLIYHHLFFATPSSAPSRRAAILNQWIQVGHMARDLGDMTSWIAIAIAICSPVVTRLSETWRSVDKRLIKLVTKRWVPVLLDLGLYSPLHPGKPNPPKCMVLLQEPSAKRSPTKFIIPYFGALKHFVLKVVKKNSQVDNFNEQNGMRYEFNGFHEVYSIAQALQSQWPYSLSHEAYKNTTCPFKIKKVYFDYFESISSTNNKDQGSFGGEIGSDYLQESLHKRSLICEMSFVDDYITNEKNPSRLISAIVSLKFPKSLPNSPLFIDLISSHFPLNNSNIGLDNSNFGAGNNNNENGLFRKRTQSVPVSAYSSPVSRESARKVSSNQFDNYDNKLALSKLGALKESLLLVKDHSLILFKVPKKESAQDPLEDLNHLSLGNSTINDNLIEVQVCSGKIEELVEILVYGLNQYSPYLLNYKENPLYGGSNLLKFDSEEYREIFFCTFRSITTPKRLFELLKECFNKSLSKVMTNSKPSEDLFQQSVKEEAQILDIFKFWITYHFHDFLDSPDLLELIFIFLHSLSERMSNILDKSISEAASELHILCETRSLTPIVSSGNKVKEERNEPVFRTPYALMNSPAGSTENLLAATASVPYQVSSWDLDLYTENQLLDAFHHFIAPMLKKATPKDYLLSSSLLEAQSISNWSWLSSSKPLSYSEDETAISDIFSLLENCRRRCTILNSTNNSTQNQNQTSLTCDRVLVSLFPRPIADLWQFRDKIRTWAIQQVSIELKIEERIERIIKLIKMVIICRRKMIDLASSHYQLLAELMSLPQEEIEKLLKNYQLPSFVERGLLSGLISPESRCFNRAWNEIASKYNVPIDDLNPLIEAIERTLEEDLPQIEIVTPCVGYVFESICSIIRSLPDHSAASTSILNFSKRTVIYKLLQCFTEWVGIATVNPPNRKGFDTMKLLSGLEALKKPDWVMVKQIASAENGNTHSNYATSIYHYATGTGSFRRIFGTIVSEQLEKQKLENREREKVMREVKAHQLEMLKKQQEQAKLYDKQQKEQQVRKAKTKELMKMASLYKTVQSSGDTSLSLSKFSSITSKKPVHVIKLINSTTIVDEGYTKRDFVIRIITEEGGEYLIQCLDKVDMDEWVHVINVAAQQAAARRVTLLAQDLSSLNEEDNSTSIVTAKSRNSVFGVELSKVMKDKELPLVVKKCIAEVEKRGLDEVGIYRVPGSASRISALCKAFDEDSESMDLTQDEWGDINVVACTLKQYLRDLPEPIATYELYDSFISAVTVEDYDERLFAIKDVLPKLPEQNYIFLKTLIEHLEHVTDFEETNHMYATNLAIVFGPTIFRPPPSESSFALSMANLGHQQNLVKNLILQYHWLFDVEAEVEESHDDTMITITEPMEGEH
ncbi:hypothetical protein K502DRAFT_313094 [Neoconidiobolus thromboides FSU 785]|nr:hypothetical protein K502DRAFT_313094 [Neoconidiobolus thromboides FSU 785]